VSNDKHEWEPGKALSAVIARGIGWNRTYIPEEKEILTAFVAEVERVQKETECTPWAAICELMGRYP